MRLYSLYKAPCLPEKLSADTAVVNDKSIADKMIADISAMYPRRVVLILSTNIVSGSKVSRKRHAIRRAPMECEAHCDRLRVRATKVLVAHNKA